MRRHSWLKGLAVFLLAIFSFEVNAASLYMDPAFSSIGRGDAIEVSVRLDTNEEEEECINAVDGVIHYGEEVIPVDVSTGDSIFSVWVEQPKINKEERTITFAGGIPNGYCGRVPGDPRLTNNVVKLIFRSPGFSIGGSAAAGTTSAKIEFAPETTAYLNDGFGTKAELALYGANIDLSSKPGAALEDPWNDAVVTDTIPPADFSIELVRIPNETGKYHIVFNTTDKQTGIDQYQVMEEHSSKFWDFEWGRADAPWITARSPYILDDQSLNSTIRVKAIDKAGNEYIATLVPPQELRGVSVEQMIMWGAIAFVALLLIIVLAVVGRSLYRRHKEKQLLVDDNNKEHDTE